MSGKRRVCEGKEIAAGAVVGGDVRRRKSDYQSGKKPLDLHHTLSAVIPVDTHMALNAKQRFKIETADEYQ